MKFWTSLLLAIASGVLASLTFPPFNATSLCWAGWTPLIASVWWGHRWQRTDWLRMLLLGYLAGVFFFWISLFWLHEVTVGGWFVLAFYLGIYPALWALFVGTVGRPREKNGELVWLNSWNNLRLAVLGAAAWTGLEWLRGILFTGFGWNSQGVALHRMIPLIQIADITGVYGLSFLIVMANLIVVLTIKRFSLEIKKYGLHPHFDFTLTLALIAGVFLYGVRQIVQSAPELQPVRIACIQAAIPQPQKWDPAFDEQILRTYQEQSQAATHLRPDLLIWPEAATPHPALLDERDRQTINTVSQSFTGDFLVGTIHFSGNDSLNSAVLFSDHGTKTQIYTKIHLVPFGEYIPLRYSFPLFAWIVNTLIPNDFTPGKKPIVFAMQSLPLRVAPLICFEDTLGNLARLFALKGANFFSVITNDGWFGTSSGSQQHLTNAVFRAAEFKLPMVRCANTGITCFINRFGAVTQKLENTNEGTFGAGILVGELQVPTHPKLTFYARFGNVFPLAMLAVAGVAILFHRLKKPQPYEQALRKNRKK